jgi:hypothetical protein
LNPHVKFFPEILSPLINRHPHHSYIQSSLLNLSTEFLMEGLSPLVSRHQNTFHQFAVMSSHFDWMAFITASVSS